MNPGTLPDRRVARFLSSALAISMAGTSYASTIVVTRTSDDNGTICDAAGCSLRAAINVAQSGDEIVFSPNLPYPVTIRLESTISIAKSLSIRHGSRGAVTLDARPVNPANTSRFRVLEISGGANVTITGLNLAHGAAFGATGATGATPGAAGDPGGDAAGGCVWVGAESALALQSVTISDCEARGGTGGIGALGRNGTPGVSGGLQQAGGSGGNGGIGGRGGRGGYAYGSGIFAYGDLILIDSSIVRNVAIAGTSGNGGKGGNGGNGGTGGAGGGTGTGGDGGAGGDGGRGGNAGEGGTTNGGGVYISASGTIQSVNSVIANNQARGGSVGDFGAGGNQGSGGNGGIGRNPGERGVDGNPGGPGSLSPAGSAFGGGIATEGADTAGLLSFTSIVKNFAGRGTEGPSTPVGASASGGGTGSLGRIEVRNSIIANNAIDNANPNNCYSVLLHTSGINMGDSSICGFTLVTTSPGVTYDESGSVPLVRLEPASPAIDAVTDCRIQADGIVNTMDIRGAVRPQDGNGDGIARCDLGAYEADAVGNDVIFRSGFEP